MSDVLMPDVEEQPKAATRRVADPELLAMHEVVQVMNTLDADAARRVGIWFADRYGDTANI